MNPTTTSSKPNVISSENLLERAFENTEFPLVEPVDEIEVVTHSEEDKLAIKNSWAEFYSLRTEDITSQTPESPVERIQLTETKIDFQVQPLTSTAENEENFSGSKQAFFIKEQKGSGSWVEDAGLKLNFKGLLGVFGSVGKSLFGALSLFREIATDTTTMVIGKKDKKTAKAETDPAKAEAAAKKKAENQRKQGNIRAFYEGLKAQAASVVTVEAVRMDTQEKENINKTVKFTNVAYKGIKDSFGRLTIYAASMFEREQMDQEKQAKKQEKEIKMASAVATGPDLNMDKVAEGGFLSATGGQGAG